MSIAANINLVRLAAAGSALFVLRIELPLQSSIAVRAVWNSPQPATELRVVEDGFGFDRGLLHHLLVALANDLMQHVVSRSFSEVAVFEPDIQDRCRRLIGASAADAIAATIDFKRDRRVEILSKQRSITVSYSKV